MLFCSCFFFFFYLCIYLFVFIFVLSHLPHYICSSKQASAFCKPQLVFRWCSCCANSVSEITGELDAMEAHIFAVVFVLGISVYLTHDHNGSKAKGPRVKGLWNLAFTQAGCERCLPRQEVKSQTGSHGLQGLAMAERLLDVGAGFERPWTLFLPLPPSNPAAFHTSAGQHRPLSPEANYSAVRTLLWLVHAVGCWDLPWTLYKADSKTTITGWVDFLGN
ncbi:hypothetical protein ANANG_G00243970 [Anguilla anguilla]|uniref:Uncharacterized protein n=1 Tax=Anguilla anguilla TaxID=7936 RepID=A0A9D3LTM3_ANGAN|nr:hypothetical protein ANANG_G00243970 [Anguilla anguilla]